MSQASARRDARIKPAKVAKDRTSDARAFVTPEGVDLRLRVADAAERATAFLIDVGILVLTLIVFSILCVTAALATGFARAQGLQVVAVVWLLGFFLLRNFYFVGFELRPRAATPGKRMLGLRVIARSGERLTADAVFARNALRELEIFLPATFLFARGRGVDGLVILLGVIWTGVFLLFPLFNRDRLRAGDLIAGTLVVASPKKLLPPDLAERPLGAPDVVLFTQAQLDAYGVKELHVLEEVLRSADRRTMAAVATRIRIRAKISWTEGPDVTDRTFLAAYYKGLRGRLEHRMLFGHRRKDKHDKV